MRGDVTETDAQASAVPAHATPAGLIAFAMQRGDADLDRLERLMELQIKWDERQARNAFITAMAAFKADPPTIEKANFAQFPNSKGYTTEYAYANLADVVKAVAPALAKHGLSHQWSTSQDAGSITVACVITHQAGHSERITLTAQPDASGGKNSIQALGSAISYLQKYTLLAITGLAASDLDDDGQNGGGADGGDQQGAGGQEQRSSVPRYTDEKLDENLPSWRKLIANKRKTPEEIIATVRSSFSLTEQQAERIRALATKTKEGQQ